MAQTLWFLKRGAPKGVAILIVLAVLAGLMALAAPFVFSMVQHGRSARGNLNAEKAAQGANAGLAHGIAEISKRTYKDFATDPTPEVTALADIWKIEQVYPSAKKDFYDTEFNPTDPRGLIISSKAEDEQAKININTAPPALIGNLLASAILMEGVPRGATQLPVDNAKNFNPYGGVVCLIGERTPLRYESAGGGMITLREGCAVAHLKGALVFDGRARYISNYVFRGTQFVPYRSLWELKSVPELRGNLAITPEEFARIERFLTVQSGMKGPLWGRGERVSEGNTTVDISGCQVENGQGFSPGTLVRMRSGGEVTGFDRVRTVRMGPKSGALVEFETAISGSDREGAEGTYVEPQLKNPININTASQTVLEAVLTGVCMQASKEPVTHQIAEALVEYMMRGKRIYRSELDLRRILEQAHTEGLLTASQRDAVFINATQPNSSKLMTSTVPFCFHAFGDFTFEGAAVLNNDAGAQLARNVVRQLVSLPTRYPGRFKIEWQAGFQELLDQGMGHRLVTFPIALGKQRYQRGSPLIGRVPSENSGSIRLDVGETGSMLNPRRSSVIGEWLEHCDDEHNGAYRQDGYDFRKHPAITPNLGSGGRGQGQTPVRAARLAAAGLPTPTGPQSDPASIELWYKPMGGGPVCFYDHALEDERNRIMVVYDPNAQPQGGIVVRIWDACLTSGRGQQHKPIEFIYPCQLDAKEWHHVAASWKSSFPGGQEIRVDAKPFPNSDPTLINIKPGGRLRGGLGLTDTNYFEVEDIEDEDFPISGAVKIGEEIIEYRSRNGTRFEQLNRGARLTAAARHEDGEWVIPHGYVNYMVEQLPKGGATLVERIEKESETVTRVSIPPNLNPPFVLQTDVSRIPVDSTVNFPPTGFITVGGELIYYGRKTATTFEKLIRAQGSGNVRCPARNIHNGNGVALASIEINKNEGYNPQGIIQLDDERNERQVEWIRYAQHQTVNGKHYLTAKLEYASPVGTRTDGSYGVIIRIDNPERIVAGESLRIDEFRGVSFHDVRFQHACTDVRHCEIDPAQSPSGRFRIRPETAHDKKTKVIPVIHMRGPHCGGGQALNDSMQSRLDGAKLNADFRRMEQLICDELLLSELPFYSKDVNDGISNVTVMDDQNHGELRYIKQAAIVQEPVRWPGSNYTCDPNTGRCRAHFTDGWHFEFLIGLDDFVTQDFPAGSKIMRWPCGDLPDFKEAKRYVGADHNGNGHLNGHVDEIRVNTYSSKAARIAMTTEGEGMKTGDETVVIENVDAFADPFPINVALNWPNEGLIRIEDELIYYTTYSTTNVSYYVDTWPQLKDRPPEKNKADRRWWNPCSSPVNHELKVRPRQHTGFRLAQLKRGVLKTKAADHPIGAQVMLLDAMAVSTLTSSLANEGDSFTVRDAAGFPNEGYAWINDEVVSYKRRAGNTFDGCKYFHGRYGTTEADHEVDSIVRCLPFRYWDRYAKFYDGTGIATLQAGYSASDATWDAIEMRTVGTEETPHPSRSIPMIMVRFNGAPAWDVDPTNKEGGLFEITGKPGDQVYKIRGSALRGVEGEQIEMRVFWKYMPGAFDRGFGKDWKRTFSIERLRANYRTPMIQRRLDELEKR